MKKRNYSARWRLERMPNLDSTPQMVEFYQSVLGCDSDAAYQRLKQDQALYHSEPTSERSPIVFDQTSRKWHGLRTKSQREAIGSKRAGSTKRTLRDILRDQLGTASYFRQQLIENFKQACGCDDKEAESKLKQARTKRIIVHDDPTNTWRFHNAPAPNLDDYGLDSGESRRAHYVRLYGNMPRLKRRPGETYSPELSEVLPYILKQSGNADLLWAECEFNRVKRYGMHDLEKSVFIYDDQTGETMGVLVARSEQAAKGDQIEKEQPLESAKASGKNGKSVAPDKFEEFREGGSWLITTLKTDDDGDYIDGSEIYYIGPIGKEERISKYQYERIVGMKRMPEKEVVRLLKDIAGDNFPAKQFIDVERREDEKADDKCPIGSLVFNFYKDGSIEGSEYETRRKERRKREAEFSASVQKPCDVAA
jgi:hypothetical protein